METMIADGMELSGACILLALLLLLACCEKGGSDCGEGRSCYGVYLAFKENEKFTRS